jgi:hypothetical protein
MKSRIGLSLLSWIIIGIPSVASADTGVPMIFITLPGMFVALIPVMVIEMLVIRRILDAEWRETAVASVVTNATSTFVGIPLAWAVYFLFEMVVGIPSAYLNNLGPVLNAILFAAWLAPDEKNYYWMVPLSAMVLLVWFFYVSYWIERAIGKRLLRRYAVGQVYKAFWHANIVSYVLLELVTLGFLVYALVAKHI